jgi:hypothetical protein
MQQVVQAIMLAQQPSIPREQRLAASQLFVTVRAGTALHSAWTRPLPCALRDTASQACATGLCWALWLSDLSSTHAADKAGGGA